MTVPLIDLYTGPPLPVAGEIGIADDGVDEPFWTGLAERELRLPRCVGCGRFVWPARWTCPHCLGEQTVWQPVPAVGRVYSWTRTHHVFTPEFADVAPYTVVLVELTGASPCRLLGLLVDGSEVAIGDRVTGVVQPPSELTSGLAVLRWSRVEETA